METPVRFKTHEAVIGRQAVLGTAPDSRVYVIREVFNYEVRLNYYEDGQEKTDGFHSVTTCFHPTQEQINHDLTRT